MQKVILGHSGNLVLDVDTADRDHRGTIEYLTVEADLPSLQARLRVYEHNGFSGLPSFFETLESHWRGWDGETRYASLEGDFQLAARHDGHIRLSFELNDFLGSIPWKAAGKLTLDPGEELSTAVEALRQLLTAPRS